MQGQVWSKSVNPPEGKLAPGTLNAIATTLLGYKFNSQYYLNVPDKSQLNIILFLCLYNAKTMKSKKTTAALNKINQFELKEIQDEFFNTHGQAQILDIPNRVEQAAFKFQVHEKLIKDNVKLFEALSLNTLFDHEYYKNKLQVREFVDYKLIPFKNITFSQRLQIKNDIVIIPYQTGYLIACYSTNNQADNRASYMRPKKEPKKQEQAMELKQDEETFQIQRQQGSKEKEQLKKNSQQEDMAFKEEQYIEPSDKNSVTGDKKQESITFFALIVILGYFCLELYYQTQV